MKYGERKKDIKSLDSVSAYNPTVSLDIITIETCGVPYILLEPLEHEMWENGKVYNRGISFSGSLELTVEQAKKLIKEMQEGIDKVEEFNQSVRDYFEKEKQCL